MTELLSGPSAPSDAELIARVRGGDLIAYGALFERHVEAARRLARQLMRGPDVDDLVSDAFARTLSVLRSGGGPDVAFRAYLLTSVRRAHVDRVRAARRVQPTDDMTTYDPGVAFQDPAVVSFDNGAAARAFHSLPERWQLVLWHLEVEGQKPADIAPLLGLSPNSVSALAYRAREGLRQAFLTMHATEETPPECRWVTERLGGYVRNGLSRRDSAKVDAHLKDCRRCTAVYLELTEVNSDLAGIIGPLLLGAAASAYASAAGGSGMLGVSALLGRLRDAVGLHSGAAATGGSGAATSGAIGGGGGLLAGGALTGSGALAIGGVAAAAIAVTTTAALLLGGGTPSQPTAPPVAGSDVSTTPSHGPAAAEQVGPGPSRPGSGSASRSDVSSGAAEMPAQADSAEDSPLDRATAGIASPEAAAAGEPVPHARLRVSVDQPGDAAERTGATRGLGHEDGGFGSPHRSGDGDLPPPTTTPSWPAVQQPTDSPGPPPYGSPAPTTEERGTPPSGPDGGSGSEQNEGRNEGQDGGQDGGQDDGEDGGTGTTGGSGAEEPDAGGDQSRGDAGRGKGNDNGRHHGYDRGRGHDPSHGKGHGHGHGHDD